MKVSLMTPCPRSRRTRPWRDGKGNGDLAGAIARHRRAPVSVEATEGVDAAALRCAAESWASRPQAPAESGRGEERENCGQGGARSIHALQSRFKHLLARCA